MSDFERRPLYHYTNEINLRKILKSGEIRTTESNISERIAHAGPKVVWLTDNPETEASVVWSGEKGRLLAGTEGDKTRVRIAVRTPAIRWTHWEWAARMTKGARTRFIERGGGLEIADHWYIALAPIVEAAWTEVVTPPEPGTPVDFRALARYS